MLAALNHDQPHRVPFAWGFGLTGEMAAKMRLYLASSDIDWTIFCQLVTDIIHIDPASRSAASHSTDIWGVARQSVSYGEGHYSEISFHPLAEATVSYIESYPWPDPLLYDFEGFAKSVRAHCSFGSKAVRSWGGNPFELYTYMAGLETAMINLLTDPEVVKAALSHITDFLEERLSRLLVTAGDVIDIIFLADDLGGQHGPLMSPSTYCSLIQPCHRRLTSKIKQLAPHIKILYHSDGAVFDLLPHLIDAGIDCLEAVQLDANGMDADKLKAKFGSKLAFHGAISVQQLLPFCDETAVYDECRRLADVLGAGGGYVAAPSHAIQVGTPPQNVMAMLKAILGEVEFDAATANAQVSKL